MIDDKYKRAVREIGRFSYFEPNNLDMNAPDNAIVNNPEDYCISVSLSVWLADRNSCGDGTNKRKFVFESQNGTISFMGGSGKGDGNPGYLTTNFTEINNGSDSRGNKECLGIEYINITYDSWFFPTVQIKFVDIKGAALMDPSETAASISMINNPQDITQISSGSFYRALFAYPRPLFKLAVKGFYGKEVTFDLTVKDSKIDFDSKSGNFTMVVNFIGFMYGVYTDIPMTYLMVAPYINPSYWETATDTRLKIGSTPIPRFPELMRDLMKLNNETQDKINATPEGKDFNTKSEYLNNVKSFDNLFTNANGKNHTPWIKLDENNDYGFTYALIQDEKVVVGEAEKIAADIETTYETLKGCGMNVNIKDDWGQRIQTGDNGYVFIPQYYVNGNGDLLYVRNLIGGAYQCTTEEPTEEDGTKKNQWAFVGDVFKSNWKKDQTEKANELLQKLRNCGAKIDGTEITDLRNKYVTFTSISIDKLKTDYTKELEKDVRKLEGKVTEIKKGIVEKELGFNLTIENVFKIIFAHMDAFVAAYYDMLGNIKSKIVGKERLVKRIFGEGRSTWHDIPDNVDSVSPFPYYCEDKGDGYVAVYPKDYCPDECTFVESILQSSDKYNKAYDEAMKEVEKALEDQRRGTPLNTNTESFIPLSFNDMLLNKGGYNPYSVVFYDKVDDKHKFDQLMLVFLLRLAYLAEMYQTKKNGELFKYFGEAEAENFRKAYTVNKSLATEFLNRKDSGINPQSIIFQEKSIFDNHWKYNEETYENLLPVGIFDELQINSDIQGNRYKDKKYLVINNGILSGTISGSTFFIDKQDSVITNLVKNVNKAVEKDNVELGITTLGNLTFDEAYGKKIKIEGVNDVIETTVPHYGTSMKTEIKASLNQIMGRTSKAKIRFNVGGNSSLTDGIVWGGNAYKSVFQSEWFNRVENIKQRAYFYIFSVPVAKEYRNSSLYNGAFLKTALLQEGAYYWYKENSSGFTVGGYIMPSVEEVPVSKKDGDYVCTLYKNEEKPKYVSSYNYFNGRNSDREVALKDFFDEWVCDEFNQICSKLDGDENYESHINEEQIQEFFVTLYASLCTTYDVTKPITTNNTNKRENNITNAFNAFVGKVKEIFDADKNTNVNQAKLTSYSQTNYDHRDDFRLSTYLNLKNLYDKWFASSDRSTWTYSEDPTANPDSEFNNFFYIDTFYNDIGDKVTVNGDVLIKLIKESLSTTEMKVLKDSPEYKGRSLFEFLSLIAQNCEMTLLALPQAYALKGLGEGKNDHIADVFRPLPFGRMVSGKNKSGDDKLDYASTVKHSYVCLYSHKPSAHLDDGFMYKNDSYDINVTNESLLPTPLQKVGKNSIPAFGVSFGKMNQSYFKDIGFDMSDQQVTEETINTTQSIAANGSDGTPINGVLYGQDLYRVFSNYAYKCNVEMMGDAQIMPLMYFQLNNIPMWRGAYMIIKVEHSIRANTMTTKFTGVRQSKNQMPFVEDGISYTNHNGDDRAGTELGSREGRFFTGDPTSGSLYGAGSVTERSRIRYSGKSEGIFKLQDAITVIGTDNDPDITKEKPIIVLTPAHGPKNKDKYLEHQWSKNLIKNYIVPMLSDRLGQSFKSHIKVDETATGSGYSCKLAKEMVLRYGSERVISIVPHWNGGGGEYFSALVNEDAVREDALRFSQIFANEAMTMIRERGIPIAYKNPTPLASQVKKYGGTDPAIWLNCACVLTENFFADYKKYANKGWDNEEPAEGTGRKWLDSPEGLKTIAELHVNAIEKYIKSLSS